MSEEFSEIKGAPTYSNTSDVASFYAKKTQPGEIKAFLRCAGFGLTLPREAPTGVWVSAEYTLPTKEGVMPPPGFIWWRDPPNWWRRLLRRPGKYHTLPMPWKEIEK